MTIDDSGWLHPVAVKPSPYFNHRPVAVDITLLVIHSISLPPGEYGGPYIDELFLGKKFSDAHPYLSSIQNLEVSTHFLINRLGKITQYVSIFDRAWHAGQSCFDGQENCNDFSIGIELEGCDEDAFAREQYQSLAQLTQAIQVRFPKITRDRITGHSDIAPGRKTDPGPKFDWDCFFKLIAVKTNVQQDEKLAR